jgi:hypothetical protein
MDMINVSKLVETVCEKKPKLAPILKSDDIDSAMVPPTYNKVSMITHEIYVNRTGLRLELPKVNCYKKESGNIERQLITDQVRTAKIWSVSD